MRSWKKLHVAAALIQDIREDCLKEVLGEIHIAFEIAERALGLDHPELCQVPAGIGILSAECRSECVDISESSGKSLCFQLSADSQVGLLTEKVFFEIHFAGVIGFAWGI